MGIKKKRSIGRNADFLNTKPNQKNPLHLLACVRFRLYPSICGWLILSSE